MRELMMKVAEAVREAAKQAVAQATFGGYNTPNDACIAEISMMCLEEIVERVLAEHQPLKEAAGGDAEIYQSIADSYFQPSADQRAAFEAWFRHETGMPDFVNFDQTAPWAEFAYKAWQAARASQPSGEPVGEVACGRPVFYTEMPPLGTKLYTAPQPAPSVLSDQQRKNWQFILSQYDKGSEVRRKGASEMAIEVLRTMLAADKKDSHE